MSENLPAVLVRSVGWEVPAMAGGGFVLPSGTVTLVLGDVEGSTRAWESDPATTETALSGLNELIDELVGRFDGVRPVEQGEGDSFVAAFARARDGIGAALAIQQALAGAPLRLRLGVHTGDVVRRDEGNYVGPAIIRTARLRNLAHGGQTVVSEATRELMADNLPAGVSLRDLGVHRLKDLSRPERVFQLCHPDLADAFPALRSLDAHPHNLPIQRSTFIGRAAEIAELAGLISHERLVTVIGSGGCGKTRLAIQVAAEMVEAFPDGVWFVELAAVTDADGVAAKAAQALAVLQGPGMAPTDAVVAHLRAQEALVIFDNCEHVAEAAAAVADALLSGCGRVRVLATSRQPLAVEGEACWRVPPLSLPPDDAGPAGIEGLSGSEAAQLFVERAGRARPGFEAEERHLQAIAQICRRLDGIPLAIELAAARVRVLTPSQIADGLNQRFALLTGAARTALPRQQTLEASLDWSHALLTEPERLVFRRLGVFPASFDLDAAAAVCTGDPIEPWQVLDLLTLLVDKNLVTVDDGGDVARYRLLETMRLYARQRLDGAEATATSIHHRDHYLALAETAGPFLESAQAPTWYARLDADYPNLDAALTWSRDRDHGDAIGRMVTALCPIWTMGGTSLRLPASAGVDWIDTALSTENVLTPRMRGVLAFHRSVLAFVSLDLETAARMGQEGLRIAREHNDDLLLGRFLLAVGLSLGLAMESEPVWDEAIGALRRAGDTYTLAAGLGGAALFYLLRDPSAARACIDEALTLARTSANINATSGARVALGRLLYLEGRSREAIAELDEAWRVATTRGFAAGIAAAEFFRAPAYAEAGALGQALAAADHLEELGRRTGIRHGESFVAQTRALVAAASGDHTAAGDFAQRALASPAQMPVRASALVTAAVVHLAAGQHEAARSDVAELIELSRAEGLIFSAAQGVALDARLRRLAGDSAAAEQTAHTALAQAVDLPAWSTVVDALETLAGLAADGHSWAEAGRLLGAAAALRDTTGYRLCLSERDADTAVVHDALGQQRFDAAYGEGRALSIEGAVAYARRGRGERKRPTVGWDSLTPTETQIVDLLRDGLTNADIGERLFVSPRTVQAHLTRIYTKLGVTSRTELAARAATERP